MSDDRLALLDFSRNRPADMRKLPPGLRVQYKAGQWETDKSNRGDYYFVTHWAALPWAYVTTGTTVTDLEAQHGVDWVARGCGAWAVPECATGIRTDDGRLTWVRTSTSCLDVVGYAEKAADAAGAVQQELFA